MLARVLVQRDERLTQADRPACGALERDIEFICGFSVEGQGQCDVVLGLIDDDVFADDAGTVCGADSYAKHPSGAIWRMQLRMKDRRRIARWHDSLPRSLVASSHLQG